MLYKGYFGKNVDQTRQKKLVQSIIKETVINIGNKTHTIKSKVNQSQCTMMQFETYSNTGFVACLLYFYSSDISDITAQRDQCLFKVVIKDMISRDIFLAINLDLLY